MCTVLDERAIDFRQLLLYRLMSARRAAERSPEDVVNNGQNWKVHRILSQPEGVNRIPFFGSAQGMCELHSLRAAGQCLFTVWGLQGRRNE